MEVLKIKLLTLWVQQALHISLQRAAEIILSFLVVGSTVTTVVTITPIHHVLFPPKPAAPKIVASTPAPIIKKATPPTVSPQTKPTPTVTTPSQPVAQTPTVTPVLPITKSSKPLSVSQPSPGSGVKQLVPTTTSSSSSSSASASSSSSPTPTLASGGYDSTNWSGYAALSGNFTAISGTWTVPSLTTNNSETSGDATWVGIGGVSSNDLIQAGTEDSVAPDGAVSIFAFYELLPYSSLQITSFPISPGNSITVNITEGANQQWTISITDNTTGENYTTVVSYSSSNSSAEWIEEDPSYQNGSQIPFDDFKQIIFSGGSTTNSGTAESIGTSNASAIQLVDGSSNPIVTPSVLTGSSNGFWAIHD